MSSGSVWLTNGKVIMRGGEVFLYPECPCDCEPKVLGSKVLNGASENEEDKCWDLTPYQGNEIGTPGFYWRLIEVGEDGSCSGVNYGGGNIDDCGKLVGLQDEFCSDYGYDGYMELQQGCPDEEGNIKWPCPDEYEE